MNKTYIKQFQFELWSNTIILESLRKLEKPVSRANFLFSHLINSHTMWISRLLNEPLKVGLFEERSLDDNEKLMKENNEKWIHYLEKINTVELERIIFFDGAWDGSKRKMMVEDVFIHLINHSSYHRGQIVASIKGFIETLPLSTYIMYTCEIV